jgi:multiple sugar transport system ATP-binding protein
MPGRGRAEGDAVAEVALSSVGKVYPDGTRAVTDLSIEVADGEFLVLVGPSGCGKTTALRMVAGLEDISEGEVAIGGRVVNRVPARDRDVAMVFQSYALYPHLSVRDNIGFGLSLRRLPKKEIREKVEHAARILGLTDHLDRKPRNLSGGQRQRVAMGRAIVREPQAFLMDEPLSNLDAKLRVSMRASLSQLHERLKVTTVYVTHDQVEAMTLGSRVCVLREGRLQQVDTPQRLFDNPVNLFVAGFIGSPAMNFATAELERDDDGARVSFAGYTLPVPADLLEAKPGLEGYIGKPLILGIRPSDFEDAAHAKPEWAPMAATCTVTEELGSEINVIFTIDAPPVEHKDTADLAEDAAEGDQEMAIPLADNKALWTARVNARSHVRPGQDIELAVDTRRLHFFDPETGLAIGHSGATAGAKPTKATA